MHIQFSIAFYSGDYKERVCEKLLICECQTMQHIYDRDYYWFLKFSINFFRLQHLFSELFCYFSVLETSIVVKGFRDYVNKYVALIQEQLNVSTTTTEASSERCR